MRKLTALLLFTVISTLPGVAEPIDFTPGYVAMDADSTLMTYLRFKCGKKQILLYPPKIWTVRGGGGSATFTQKEVMDAEAKFENAPAGMPALFDEKGLETYRRIAQTLLPQRAPDLALVAEQPKAIEINDWDAFEMTFKYSKGSLRLMHTILFLKLDEKREIRITIIAPEAIHPKWEQGIRGILATWFEE